MRIWIIIFLLIATACHAQQFGSGFNDFGSDFADATYTDTSRFTHGILGASDYTVQRSLQTLDQRLGASGASVIINCDKDVDDFCFDYTSNVLALYVNQAIQQQWPISVAVLTDKLLLEDLSGLLLEDGTSFILLE